MYQEATMRGLRSVRVSKDAVLDTIKKNRDEHRQIYEEAIDGWQKEVVKELESAVAAAKNGVFRTRFDLPMPQDHTKEYNRAVTMLEASLDDELELSDQEFSQYVMDEWGWQRDFLASSANYGSITARGKGGKV